MAGHGAMSLNPAYTFCATSVLPYMRTYILRSSAYVVGYSILKLAAAGYPPAFVGRKNGTSKELTKIGSRAENLSPYRTVPRCWAMSRVIRQP